MFKKSIVAIILCLLLSTLILPGCSAESEEADPPPTNGPQLIFYEGNNATQDKVCSIPAETDTWHFKNHSGWNDEARSLVLQDVPSGTVIRIADDPNGATDDDYTDIYVKTQGHSVIIPSFEQSYEDDYVKVKYHSDNGLDGKVSYCDITVW